MVLIVANVAMIAIMVYLQWGLRAEEGEADGGSGDDSVSNNDSSVADPPQVDGALNG